MAAELQSFTTFNVTPLRGDLQRLRLAINDTGLDLSDFAQRSVFVYRQLAEQLDADLATVEPFLSLTGDLSGIAGRFAPPSAAMRRRIQQRCESQNMRYAQNVPHVTAGALLRVLDWSRVWYVRFVIDELVVWRSVIERPECERDVSTDVDTWDGLRVVANSTRLEVFAGLDAIDSVGDLQAAGIPLDRAARLVALWHKAGGTAEHLDAAATALIAGGSVGDAIRSAMPDHTPAATTNTATTNTATTNTATTNTDTAQNENGESTL